MTNVLRGPGLPQPDLSRAHWRTSTKSGGNGNCVEVADLGSALAVRDSKNPTGPVLVWSRDEWATFLAGIRAS
jgi:hypothetical protein